MNPSVPTTWIAFSGATRIATGAPEGVAASVQALVEEQPEANVSVFDATTSQPVDMDGPGSLVLALSRLPRSTPESTAADAPAARAPGRPKLGVTAREVTLLPRHWEWLATQTGGASVALRKLVEQAQRVNKDADRIRQARESAYRFMNAMAGNEQGFEEATRALFAGDAVRLATSMQSWPQDIREHVQSLIDVSTEDGAQQ
jgi:hypothetical protein